jgi:putative endonuclease
MRSTGNVFEDHAHAALLDAGFVPLTRNYNTRYGELDLIMLDRQTIVFVEVRYRRSVRCGSALDSITASKRAKLILAAQKWLISNPRHAHRPCRFDVVSYDGPRERAQMTWTRNAFTTD